MFFLLLAEMNLKMFLSWRFDAEIKGSHVAVLCCSRQLRHLRRNDELYSMKRSDQPTSKIVSEPKAHDHVGTDRRSSYTKRAANVSFTVCELSSVKKACSIYFLVSATKYEPTLVH